MVEESRCQRDLEHVGHTEWKIHKSHMAQHRLTETD